MVVVILNACLMILEHEIRYIIRTEFLLVVVHLLSSTLSTFTDSLKFNKYTL